MRGALVLVLVSACGGSSTGQPDAPPADAAPRGQGSEPTSDVVINEVAASGLEFVELANRGATEVDLSGWFVTDAPDRLDHFYPFPTGTVLGPGAYLLVYTDDGAAGEGHHAPFELGRADGVFVLGRTGLIVDSLLYLAMDGRPLARQPDHEGLFFPAEGTPGGANPGVSP